MRPLLLTSVTAFVISALVPGVGHAEQTVPIISEGALKKRCQKNKGGVFSPSSASGVYVCLTGTGGVIVCGGGTPEQKKTCSIGRMMPSDRTMIRSRAPARIR